MKKKYITKIITKEKLKDRTDWKRVRAMTEEQILEAARSDPDAQPLTLEELKKFRRVNPPKPSSIDVKRIRMMLQVSQSEFAGYFGVSVRTIQEWEQNRRVPNQLARNFLKVIEKAPKAVLKALSS